jgi:hypothetical protein
LDISSIATGYIQGFFDQYPNITGCDIREFPSIPALDTMAVLGTVTVLEVLEGPLFQQLPPAFFLLAKKSGRDESWVVYF